MSASGLLRPQKLAASSGATCKADAKQRYRTSKVLASCSGQQHAPSQAPPSSRSMTHARRQVLLGGLLSATSVAAGALLPAAANANVVQSAARQWLRPDVDVQQAVIYLLDARGTLQEISELAATAPDSDERFHARALLPGMAKRLREAGPAVPVVAQTFVPLAEDDKEALVSEQYGGKSSDSSVTDAVFMGLGRVLTISGRTIRPEAQRSPAPARDAYAALDSFISKVPADLLDAAQAARTARASRQ